MRFQRKKGEHLLVYQTAEGNDALVDTLAKTGLPCRIYGMRRDLKEDAAENNLLFRPFSEAGFISDLASARGVIAGGGFTLMGECVYLHKPMLSVPIGGQFEQILNGRYLGREGYGAMAPNLDDPQTVFDFVENLPLRRRREPCGRTGETGARPRCARAPGPRKPSRFDGGPIP